METFQSTTQELFSQGVDSVVNLRKQFTIPQPCLEGWVPFPARQRPPSPAAFPRPPSVYALASRSPAAGGGGRGRRGRDGRTQRAAPKRAEDGAQPTEQAGTRSQGPPGAPRCRGRGVRGGARGPCPHAPAAPATVPGSLPASPHPPRAVGTVPPTPRA